MAHPTPDRAYDWVTEPAHLTEGHALLPYVEEALLIAEGVPQRGTFLGRGNFGETYAVSLITGVIVVVKLPVEKDIHGRVWKLADIRQAFLHEAGVAGELRDLDVKIVPDIIYVEKPDGWPALVREYGEPVTEMSLEEFAEVEQALAEVEKLSWRVEDEIDLYRRDDGSVFVGDVGIWHPVATYASGKKDIGFDDSALDYLVPRLAGKLLGEPYKDTPSLFAVARSTRWAAEALDELPPAGTAPAPTGYEKHHLDLTVGSLRAKVERRHLLGLPVPLDALAVLQAATDLGL